MFPMMPKPPMKGIPIPSKKKEENLTSGSTEISNVEEQLESAMLPNLEKRKSNVYEMSYFSQLARIRLFPEILYFSLALGCCSFELEFSNT